MSGDIVKRLRAGLPCHGDVCAHRVASACDCTAAADEIERLERRVEALMPRDGQAPYTVLVEQNDRFRAALERIAQDDPAWTVTPAEIARAALAGDTNTPANRIAAPADVAHSRDEWKADALTTLAIAKRYRALLEKMRPHLHAQWKAEIDACISPPDGAAVQPADGQS